jgi:hypothetical protein
MEGISIKFGLRMLAAFITYFMLMHFMGLIQHIELRLFNGVIHFMFLFWAIREYINTHPMDSHNYILSVMVGVVTSVIGVVGFTFFVTIYLNLNDSLMEAIRQDSNYGSYLNPFSASISILAEGVIVSLIGSYLIGRYLEVPTKKVF